MKKALMIICLMWVSCFSSAQNEIQNLFQIDPSSEKLAIEICLDDKDIIWTDEGIARSCYQIAKNVSNERKKFLIYEKICNQYPSLYEGYVCMLVADKNKDTKLAQKVYDMFKNVCFSTFSGWAEDFTSAGSTDEFTLGTLQRGAILTVGFSLNACDNMIDLTSGKWSWFKQADYRKNEMYKKMACVINYYTCKDYNLDAFGTKIYNDSNFFKKFDKEVENFKMQEGVQ